LQCDKINVIPVKAAIQCFQTISKMDTGLRRYDDQNRTVLNKKQLNRIN